jgi:hypothetical protein
MVRREAQKIAERRVQSRIDQAARENEIGEEGMGPDNLLCSRSARLRKALARANGTPREIDCHAIEGWGG